MSLLSQKPKLVRPEDAELWSTTTTREKLVKIGAKVVRQGRYVTFQLAEVAVPVGGETVRFRTKSQSGRPCGWV